jgi:hypothetical protein
MKKAIFLLLLTAGALLPSCSNNSNSNNPSAGCNDFQLEVTPDEEFVPVGDTGVFGALVERFDGFDEDIQLTLGQVTRDGFLTGADLINEGIVSGFTFSPQTVSPGQNSTLEVSIAPGVPEGRVYEFKVVGTSTDSGSRCNGDSFLITTFLPGF